MENVFSWLLIFVPIVAVASALGLSPIAVFFLSALAIIPLAKFIGESTEELAARTSSALGGFLNVTFGNATELIIGIFALRAGLIDVVKATITGSILGNLLLVLGTALFAGGIAHKKQVFNRTAALASGSTLFFAVIALTMPALLLIVTPTTNPASVEWLSILIAACMILIYIASLVFSLRTHKHLYMEDAGWMDGAWPLRKSVFVLFCSTLLVAWMSSILVGAITPIANALGWTPLFIGVVFLAIVGNAAEHASAVIAAIKNKLDLTLQIAVGSATQVTMFIAPAFVFISLLFQNQMTLVFTTFELVSIFLSVLIVNIVIEDGESNWLEGAQLLIAYLIIAIAFFMHP